MSQNYFAVAFTDHVLDSQVQYGSRAALARVDRQAAGANRVGPSAQDTTRSIHDPLGSAERDFIAEQDGFYMATVSESGWPYVQFRGGPQGFVSSPDEHTLAWADFRGNRQYISTGNLDSDPRVALIFLDYARQTRLKVFGIAHVTDVDRESPHVSTLAMPGYRARVERELRIDVIAYDWNCPQHITPRFSAAEITRMTETMRRTISDLETENRALRAQLVAATKP